MADMIVSGAGNSAVNGTYVENGTLNGKPYYEFGNCKILYDPEGKWGAGWFITIDYINQYASYTNMATPDLCPSWDGSYCYGADPKPTVTAASSGTTHEGEVALSSLSYLRTKKA